MHTQGICLHFLRKEAGGKIEESLLVVPISEKQAAQKGKGSDDDQNEEQLSYGKSCLFFQRKSPIGLCCYNVCAGKGQNAGTGGECFLKT